MSRPSITIAPAVPIARCRATSSARTRGRRATAAAARETVAADPSGVNGASAATPIFTWAYGDGSGGPGLPPAPGDPAPFVTAFVAAGLTRLDAPLHAIEILEEVIVEGVYPEATIQDPAAFASLSMKTGAEILA